MTIFKVERLSSVLALSGKRGYLTQCLLLLVLQINFIISIGFVFANARLIWFQTAGGSPSLCKMQQNTHMHTYFKHLETAKIYRLVNLKLLSWAVDTY